LNHPHICTLYDVGPNYLVMELVEGESLAERLKKGPLGIDQTLQYGTQIAGALAAAHAKSITHRDLKPGNIMISKSTGVKVLDFGLAKIRSDPGDDVLTRTDVIIGTPAYMAPEQLEGRHADARSDIYSLGIVLCEMATGKRPIQGQLPETIPRRLRHVVDRCLASDPEERWQSALDIKAELQWLASDPDVPEQEPRGRKPWLPVIATIGILLVAAAAWWTLRATQEAPAQAFGFRIPIPPGLRMITRSTFSISPDGKTLAFLAARSDDIQHIWIQKIGELEARLLPGTQSPAYSPPPFWSPDSKSIAFYADGKLKRLDINGGSPHAIADVTTFSSGGSWSSDGDILFADLSRGIMRVPAAGGAPTPLTALSIGERINGFPIGLPDGRHFLYIRAGGSADVNGIYVGATDKAPEQQDSKRLLATDSAVQVLTLDDGRIKILFLRANTLMAQDFDMARLSLAGEPEAVAEPVGSSLAFAFFAASNTTIAYRAPVQQSIQFQWLDRDGKHQAAVGEPITRQSSLAISPDGQRALVSRLELNNADLWLLELSREVFVRLASSALNGSPVWAPDNKRFAFSSTRAGINDIFQATLDGSSDERVLVQSDRNKIPLSWSPDGNNLLYLEYGRENKADLWILPLHQGNASKPIPFAVTPASEYDARFSPNGRWIVYVSDETGAPEIYARLFASTRAAKIRVSPAGGTHPRWSSGGNELFYNEPDGDLMMLTVSDSDILHVGSPKKLFSMTPNLVWEVMPDGKRFLVGIPIEENTQTPFTIMMNWTAALKK
jgi:serine/threonine protein kinase